MKSAPACPVTTALSVIGGKWKVIILWQLHGKVVRFGELQKTIPGISQKMLTQELRDLEESGLVARKVYPVVPPRVEYSLTEYGNSIKPLMDQLFVWGLGFQKRMAAAKQDSLRPSEVGSNSKIPLIHSDDTKLDFLSATEDIPFGVESNSF
jgi:DNA-binding HxlR family transcriptional regulator